MKRTTLFLLCLMPLLLKAQPMNIDSLVNVLKTKTVAADQLELYYKICGTYLFYDLEKASEYATKGLMLAEKTNNKVMSSKFNAIFGRVYATRSSCDTAFVYYNKAINDAISAKDKIQEAVAYGDLGILFAIQDKYTDALGYFMKALSIYENEGNKPKCIMVMTNIASMYRTMENNERAIFYLKKAEKLAENTEDEERKMQIYFELGASYYKLAEKEKDKVELALEYELKANELSNKFSDRRFQASTAHALSEIYLNYMKDYDKALKYAQESFRIAQESQDPKMIIAALSSISSSYYRLNHYVESEEAALKAWKIDSIDINIGTNILNNVILSNIALGNKAKATQFFYKFHELTKRHLDQNSRKLMAEMEAKYEAEKKDMNIAALEKDKKLYMGFGATVLIALLSAIGVLFYRHRSATQKREIAEQKIKQLEQEKQLIAAQSALKAEKAERDLIARDLHDSVGTLLTVANNNMKLYSTSGHKDVEYFDKAFEVLGKSIIDLRRVVYHVKSVILTNEGLVAALDEFCRFIPEAEFQFHGLSRRFDPDKEYVLFNCTCELINNALKHSGASQIDVDLNMNEDTVYITVADNGCGFDAQTVTLGIGINNIRSNLSVFCGRLDIFSKLGKGTEMNIELDT